MSTRPLELLLACLCFLPTWASANQDDAVVERFNSSPSLPDYHAYRGFLNIVESMALRPGHELHFIEAAFGVDASSEEGVSRAASLFEWFSASAKEVRSEAEIVKMRTLCPRKWADMSFKEIQDARWAINDAEDRLYGEYLAAALNHLSNEEKTAFLEYLSDLKKNTSFTRIDTEKLYGERAESKARSYQVGICSAQSDLKDDQRRHFE